MDKTLGAIFSKVAFAAAANQTAVAKNEGADERNVSQAARPLESAEPSSSSTSTATTASTSTTSTTTAPTEAIASTLSVSPSKAAVTETTPAAMAPTTAATTTMTTTTTTTTSRPKPVFELDTRVFDFIPYERTAPPHSNQRQYNPNVPGLRGPSRINTARKPLEPVPNQPFHQRPTIPPLLIDLTSTSSRTTTRPSTTRPTTTAAAAVQDEDSSEEEMVGATTTPVILIKTPTTLPTTTTVATPTPTTSTTTTTTASPPPAPTVAVPSDHNEDQPGLIDGNDLKRPAPDTSRDTAWNFQVYGTSFLFVLLGVFALSNLLRLRTSSRRLLSTSHCLSVQLLVLFLAITRSIHLLYDAYNHKRLLPPALAFCIFNVAFPCLSSALAVLLLAMFKATKLQVRPPFALI